jgi:hypothetical protein
MWEIRPGQKTGGQHERRDLELYNRNEATTASRRIIVSVPWSDRVDDGRQAAEWAERLHQIAGEIAAQPALQIRR